MASPAGIYLKAERFLCFCSGATGTTRTPRAARAKGDLPYFTHCILRVEVFSAFLHNVCTHVHRALLYSIFNYNFTEYGMFQTLLPSLLKCSFLE